MSAQTNNHRGNILSIPEWNFIKPYRLCTGRSTSYLHQPGRLLTSSERSAHRTCGSGSSIRSSRSSENSSTTLAPSILGNIVLKARPNP
jgi:hypothetical protein